MFSSGEVGCSEGKKWNASGAFSRCHKRLSEYRPRRRGGLRLREPCIRNHHAPVRILAPMKRGLLHVIIFCKMIDIGLSEYRPR